MHKFGLLNLRDQKTKSSKLINVIYNVFISNPVSTHFYLKFLGRNNSFFLVFAMICDKKLVPYFDCSTGQQSAEAEIPDILSKTIKFTSWETFPWELV